MEQKIEFCEERNPSSNEGLETSVCAARSLYTSRETALCVQDLTDKMQSRADAVVLSMKEKTKTVF